MHPLTKALLSGWEWRLEIVAVLLALGLLYVLGWSRLRRQSKRHGLATWPRLAAYVGGLIVLAVSLMSPIDQLGGQLFFMHMTQHMLSIMVAAPLLLLGNPYPFMVWGLPRERTQLRQPADEHGLQFPARADRRHPPNVHVAPLPDGLSGLA